MKARKLKGSQQATIVENDNLSILFSYETPVAFKHNGRVYLPNHFFSTTTSRHQNEFVRQMCAEMVKIPKSEFDKKLNSFAM